MTTNSPKTELTHAELTDEFERALSGGLGQLSVAQMLGLTLSALGSAERSAYLERSPADKGNGSYQRSLQLGSLPVSVEVARTRSGEFRPSFLPAPYQRSHPEPTQDLLLGLLASSRSVNAARAALSKMGLSCPGKELDEIAKHFVAEIELRNTRPIDPDLFALFIDGKYVEWREGERLRPACLYVVVGLTRSGHKRVLFCQARPGRENLEEWKKILRSLIERGLRRVLLLAQDDFSGLLPVSRSLFPRTDIQLCIVHMQRNARIHLSKAEAAEFQQRIRAIKACWDPELGAQQFEELCDRFAPSAPSFIAELRKKRDHYLCFLQYPEPVRRTFSTTNVAEAVNGQLERLRRNNGGYFHSDHNLKMKLGLTVSFLEEGSWLRPAASIRAALSQLNAMFERRFESESDQPQTQLS